MRDWQLLTGSGCPHDGVSVIECAICCSSLTTPQPTPWWEGPPRVSPQAALSSSSTLKKFPQTLSRSGRCCACVCPRAPCDVA